MYHLSPSILAADFAKLGNQIEEVYNEGVDWLHIDVMDGKFVPSISFGMPVIKSIRKVSDIFFDVHLMIDEPIRYIEDFVKSGADSITVHVEACSDVLATINKIKEYGVKAGLALNPETPAEKVLPFADKVDMILVMSVHPGFGGQKFIDDTLSKMKEIHEYIVKNDLLCDLEVDGGININNVKNVIDNGVNVVVAGTAVFSGEIKTNVKDFMGVLKDGSFAG